MLVLANSRKTGGRCLAGVALDDFSWVRPVSAVGQGELSDEECAVDGHTPRLLEVVTFEHDGPEGDPAQPENVVLNDAAWTSEGMASTALVREATRQVTLTRRPLLVNNGAAVPEHVAAEGVAASLALVAPTHLRFGHGPEAHGSAPGPRAIFEWASAERNFPITDFVVGPQVLQQPPGLYAPEDLDLPPASALRLTVSLGVPHEGWCYKLVAAVVPLP